jgi:hypothetical protein
MICPQCREAGKKSRVYVGGNYTTCMYSPPFYDEEGRYHNHDPNSTTTDYTCSNGQSWQSVGKTGCWCGWPGNEVGQA